MFSCYVEITDTPHKTSLVVSFFSISLGKSTLASHLVLLHYRPPPLLIRPPIAHTHFPYVFNSIPIHCSCLLVTLCSIGEPKFSFTPLSKPNISPIIRNRKKTSSLFFHIPSRSTPSLSSHITPKADLASGGGCGTRTGPAGQPNALPPPPPPSLPPRTGQQRASCAMNAKKAHENKNKTFAFNNKIDNFCTALR